MDTTNSVVDDAYTKIEQAAKELRTELEPKMKELDVLENALAAIEKAREPRKKRGRPRKDATITA